MKITRNLILDLLPLYVADEVSAETRVQIDKYLETDPELSKAADQLGKTERPVKIPVPLGENDELKTYRKTRLRIFLFALLLAGLISIVFVSVLVFFFGSS